MNRGMSILRGVWDALGRIVPFAPAQPPPRKDCAHSDSAPELFSVGGGNDGPTHSRDEVLVGEVPLVHSARRTQ